MENVYVYVGLSLTTFPLLGWLAPPTTVKETSPKLCYWSGAAGSRFLVFLHPRAASSPFLRKVYFSGPTVLM